MKERGILVILSGFSGAGKGTMIKRLLEKHDNYALSVSWTTRDPRPGEVDGVSYFFHTQEEFDELVAKDGFLEYASYVKHSYGTPKAYVEDKLAEGQDVILEIEVQGALQVKKKCPDAMLVFLSTKDAATLRSRLVGRGTETLEVIEQRLARAAEEAESISQYEYILVNDDLDTCVEEFHNLVQSQHTRSSLRSEFIKDMQADLTNQKGE